MKERGLQYLGWNIKTLGPIGTSTSATWHGLGMDFRCPPVLAEAISHPSGHTMDPRCRPGPLVMGGTSAPAFQTRPPAQKVLIHKHKDVDWPILHLFELVKQSQKVFLRLLVI